MRYEELKKFGEEEFRRLTGVKKNTFARMTIILEEAETKKKDLGANQTFKYRREVIDGLEYIREYRTYFHISASYGISESSCYRNIKWVEDTLIKHPDFALPGKKALVKSDMTYETILIDATESPIQRPKKTKTLLFR